jgi:uncharacterized protein YuzE
MKIYYDQKVDAAYLQLSEETPTVVNGHPNGATHGHLNGAISN